MGAVVRGRWALVAAAALSLSASACAGIHTGDEQGSARDDSSVPEITVDIDPLPFPIIPPSLPPTTPVPTFPPQPEAAPTSGATGYDYTFFGVDGLPSSWDACRPIGWGYNPALMPPGFVDRIRAVLDEVAGFTGYEFSFIGTETTTEAPPSIPLYFAFADAGDARWDTGRIGVTSLTVFDDLSGVSYVTQAGIVFRAGSDWTEERQVRAIRHEIGHAMNLTHVDPLTEVMHAETPATEWGSGDIEGLGRVARDCF